MAARCGRGSEAEEGQPEGPGPLDASERGHGFRTMATAHVGGGEAEGGRVDDCDALEDGFGVGCVGTMVGGSVGAEEAQADDASCSSQDYAQICEHSLGCLDRSSLPSCIPAAVEKSVGLLQITLCSNV